MKKNVELTHEIVKGVYDDIMNKSAMTKIEVCDYITQCSNHSNQSREKYIFDYYHNIVLKDNKNNINNADNGIDDVDKVNFEELTETDKQIIESRKYMCNERVKELIQYINKLINIELSNDKHAVDEMGIIMYVVQAITRDAINAIGDTQKILELIKQKQP